MRVCLTALLFSIGLLDFLKSGQDTRQNPFYLGIFRREVFPMDMFEKVVDLLVEELQLNRDDITKDSELSGDLGINSIELADLVMICEERFGIEINDDESKNFVTVGDVVEYLESL